MSGHALEVADIFRDHGPAWRVKHAVHVSLGQLKVMSAIEHCRSAALGGHVLRCQACNHLQIAYNSCLMGNTFLWGVRPNSMVGLSSIFADLTMQPMLSDSKRMLAFLSTRFHVVYMVFDGAFGYNDACQNQCPAFRINDLKACYRGRKYVTKAFNRCLPSWGKFRFDRFEIKDSQSICSFSTQFCKQGLG